jgi:hypothetical protein
MEKSTKEIRIKTESFWSKYAFKNVSRTNKKILYEGLHDNIPQDVLDNLNTTPEVKKYVIIYL